MKFKIKAQFSPSTWDNTGFTLDRIGIQSVNDIFFNNLLVNQSWKTMMDLQTGIKHDTQVVISGNFTGLTGRNRSAVPCDTTPNPYRIRGNEKTWSPKPIGDRHEECKDDLLTTFWKNFLRKAGVDKYNLTGTEYAAYVADRLGRYIADDLMIRLIFFSNTTLTSGVTNILTEPELDYFTHAAGIFAQMETIIISDSTRGVTVTENTNATTATQVFAAPSSTVHPCTDYMATMYAAATAEMKADPDLTFFVTKAWYDAYWRERSMAGPVIELLGRTESGDLKNGGLSYMGVPVVPVQTWDRLIARHFTNGAKLDKPLRAILISKANWSVGTEEESVFSKLDVEYSTWFKKMFMEYEFNIDQKVIKDTEFVYAR